MIPSAMNSGKKIFERLDQWNFQLCGGQLWFICQSLLPFGDQHPVTLEKFFPFHCGVPAMWLGALPQTGPVRVSGLWGLDKELSFRLVNSKVLSEMCVTCPQPWGRSWAVSGEELMVMSREACLGVERWSLGDLLVVCEAWGPRSPSLQSLKIVFSKD